MVDVGEEVVLDTVDAPRDVEPSTLGHANDADVDGRSVSDSGRISDGNADEVVNWDEQLEGNDDAGSEDDDDDQGEAFDYRVDDVPAFSRDGVDILRLPHGLKVVSTPWNGEAAQDGAHIAMRFRRSAQGLVSNSKLVKWSDGSFTLQVGDEVFPVLQNALDGDNWLGVSQDTEHILLQSKLRQRYRANTVDEAQASRLINVREEKHNTQRQAQLEERIIAPENDDFAPIKGRGSKSASTKRARAASSKRYTSNLTPGDLDGKFRHDDDEEDLSAVVKSFRKNKNWQPPPQARVQHRSVVEFSSPSSDEYSSAPSSISGDDNDAKLKGRRRVVDDSD